MFIDTKIFLFLLSLLKVYCSVGEVEPVTLENLLDKFLYLKDANEKGKDVVLDREYWGKSLYQLYQECPDRLAEIAKESHSLSFNYVLWRCWIVELFRPANIPKYLFTDSIKNLKSNYARRFEVVCFNVLEKAEAMIKNLSLGPESQSKNLKTIQTVRTMTLIASEFANKISIPQEREKNLNRCKNIIFIIENLSIDYQNGSIDYGSFMEIYYEMKTICPVKAHCKLADERFKKLKSLFYIYASMIKSGHFSLIFEYHPAEELVYLVLNANDNVNFMHLLDNPKEKSSNIIAAYAGFLIVAPRFKTVCSLLVGDAESLKTEYDWRYFVKKRFFTKLSSFLELKENRDYLLTILDPDYLNGYQIWFYKGLSKFEYYLNSLKDF